jgi:hypothetical protein
MQTPEWRSIVKKVDELLERRSVTRRGFLAGMGASAGAAAALGIAGCSSNMNSATNPGSSGGGGTQPAAYTDTDILNFALNLEYLEAEFYLRATTGSGLSSADTGSSAGMVTGGAAVPFKTPAIQQYAYEIAADEKAHVELLRSALGSSAVSMPDIDFTNAFNAAAMAAGIGSSFDPFADETSFLLGSFVFEDVGVTAYHGAVTLISSPKVLAAAAGILGTEAYHAGEIRTLIAQTGGAALDAAVKIQALRAAAGGGAETTLSSTTIVNADSDSISYDRTPSEVLHIVYLNPNKGQISKGGFFPNGLNGNITTSLI